MTDAYGHVWPRRPHPLPRRPGDPRIDRRTMAGIVAGIAGAALLAGLAFGVVSAVSGLGRDIAKSISNMRGLVEYKAVTVPVGTKVTIPVTQSGIGSVAVTAWYPNVASSGTGSGAITPAGVHWAAAAVELCATPNTKITDALRTDVTLMTSPSDYAGPLPSGDIPGTFAGVPDLPQLRSQAELPATFSAARGQCASGWLAYALPNGTSPSAVQFTEYPADVSAPRRIVYWRLLTTAASP